MKSFAKDHLINYWQIKHYNPTLQIPQCRLLNIIECFGQVNINQHLSSAFIALNYGKHFFTSIIYSLSQLKDFNKRITSTCLDIQCCQNRRHATGTKNGRGNSIIAITTLQKRGCVPTIHLTLRNFRPRGIHRFRKA